MTDRIILFRAVKKFGFLLNRHQKKRIIELFLFILLAGFMEMFSVALIVPFVETILQPEKVMSYGAVIKIVRLLGIESNRTFLVFLSLLMAGLYLVKNAFLLVELSVQQRFVKNNCFLLQKEIFRSFLTRPYEFFLNAKSGEIIRTITEDTNKAFWVMNSGISLVAELIVSAILLVTIFVINPFLTVAMGGVLGLVSMIIFVLTKSRLQYQGKKYIEASGRMSQILIQTIQGVKEIKLLRREQFFLDEYGTEGKVWVKADFIQFFLSLLPRFMLEAFAMCTFFIIIALEIYKGIAIETLIPTISGIAMAAVRLLPAMNRISAGMASMTYNEPSLDLLVEAVRTMRDYEKSHCELRENSQLRIRSLRESIAMKGISYEYPMSDKYVLENIDLNIHKGQSVGFIGRSGMGKTTVVDLMLGLLNPQQGFVSVDGKNIQMDMEGWASQIGYIPQTIFMLDADIRQNVAFGITDKEIDDKMVWEALREAALDDYVRGLPDGIYTQIGERGIRISGGQRQRIGIARALYNNPEVIFFDEATSALDNETELAIMDSINLLKGSKTLIIIAHRLSTIEKCDVIYRVENGRVYRDK